MMILSLQMIGKLNRISSNDAGLLSLIVTLTLKDVHELNSNQDQFRTAGLQCLMRLGSQNANAANAIAHAIVEFFSTGSSFSAEYQTSFTLKALLVIAKMNVTNFLYVDACSKLVFQLQFELPTTSVSKKCIRILIRLAMKHDPLIPSVSFTFLSLFFFIQVQITKLY